MSIKCILIDNYDCVIDCAVLSFIDSGGAVMVPFSKETLKGIDTKERLRFQPENKHEKIFDAEILSVDQEKINLDDIRDLGEVPHRKDFRVDLDLKSCVLCETDDGYYSMDITVRNVSSGGMCFTCSENIDMDTTYETVVDWIETPIIVKIKLLRKDVCENGDSLYGCMFVDLLKEEEKLLRAGVFLIQTKNYKVKGSNVNDAVC